MIRNLKFYISAFILLSCVPYMMAYDPNDLVGSAFEFGDVDERYFMLYFQDGNIITFCVGIVCAIIFTMLRKKTLPVLRVIFVTFTLTLIVLPLYLMIIGEGYSGFLLIFIFSFYFGFLGLFIILSIVLIYWIVTLFKLKNLKQSGKAVWNLLIKGVGTVPLTYVFAFGVFGLINLLAQDWNLTQCEKYVQSQYTDYDDIAPLMLRWEAEHTLQWGEKAKRNKEVYDENHNIDFVDIEQKVKPDDSSKILYGLLWKPDSFKHPFNILKQRGWIILHGESEARLFISPDKTKGYIQAKTRGNINVLEFHYYFPQVSIANITSFHDIGSYDNVIVITTEANDTTKLYLRELNLFNNKFISLKDSILALPDSEITNIVPPNYETYTLNEDYYDKTEVLRFPTDTISQIVYEGEIIRVRFKNPEAKDKVYTHNCMIFVNIDFESGETRLRRF